MCAMGGVFFVQFATEFKVLSVWNCIVTKLLLFLNYARVHA